MRVQTLSRRPFAGVEAAMRAFPAARGADTPDELWLVEHEPVFTQDFAYHAVPTNAQAIGAYRHHVLDLWRRSLKRRSQKGHVTWARMDRLAEEWLPPPHVLHPWPEERMAVRYPR